jgi:MoxR-like ATPase
VTEERRSGRRTSPGGPDAAALVGRGDALSRLARAIDAGRSGLVRGEAGIGKTALLHAATHRSGRSFVFGRGLEMLRDVPYLALRQAFPSLPAHWTA